MFTMLGQGLGRAGRFCDLGTRRDFLRIGALGVGAGSLGLSDLLKAQAAGTNSKKSSKAKSAIFVYLPQPTLLLRAPHLLRPPRLLPRPTLLLRAPHLL